MHFTDLQVGNFRGFRDSGKVQLDPHINVLIGQNSAGKSALLEVFDFAKGSVDHAPHRSPHADFEPPQSSFKFGISLTGLEVVRLAQKQNTQLILRIPPGSNEQHLWNRIPKMRFDIRADYVPSHSPFTNFELAMDGVMTSSGPGHSLYVTPDSTTAKVSISAGHNSGTPNVLIWNGLRTQTFSFGAERYNVGRCSSGASRDLARNASNLPVCLSVLGRSRERFQEYVDLVRQVLPQVQSVSAALALDGSQDVEILVFNSKSRHQRLGIPLNNCGTGVAQVLAILYVLEVFDSAVLVIDEPNTFLHPAATKALMRIFQQRPQFQFIVSTHSPEVLTTLSPKRVLRVSWNQDAAQSQIENLNAHDLSTKRSLFSSLGISFADVFGNDKVIWVEGETEQACFELLMNVAPHRPPGLAFLAMPNASGAEAKSHAEVEAFFRMHNRVSQGAVLWPASTWFSFDSDIRSKPKCDEIQKLAGNRASFLPRRSYENYLLHPRAVTALLNDLEGSLKVDPDTIAAWFNANEASFRKRVPVSATFEQRGDAAKMLKHLISEFTETRHQYDKVVHGAWLTSWLLNHDPNAIDELRHYVDQLALDVSKS